jgi:hypothetical protein
MGDAITVYCEQSLLEPVVLKKTTYGTRGGFKIPFPMSKGEYSKEQALWLVAYMVILTNLSCTLTPSTVRTT